MQKENLPFISIITLNWNSLNYTLQFLESTRTLTYRNFEVLVVDMNSDQDPTSEINGNNYANTKVLRCEKNLGFSGGNNFGIEQAKGDFLFVVNNDTELTPEILNSLIEPFYKDSTVGVTCPKIRYYDMPSIIQYAGFNPFNFVTGRTSSVGSGKVDSGQYDLPGYTFGAHGCAMMVKRDIISKAGVFPKNYFLSYEEWDWSLRIIKSGFKIFYQPAALIYHKASMSIGKGNPIKIFYHIRNRILLIKRNGTGLQLFLFMVYMLIVIFPFNVIKHLVKLEFDKLKYFLKGTINGVLASRFSNNYYLGIKS